MMSFHDREVLLSLSKLSKCYSNIRAYTSSLEITSFMKGRLMAADDHCLKPNVSFLSYDFEDSIGILKAHYLNHITSYHIISYHNILYDMKIFISESESYHNHIICISYSYHIIPKLKLLADMFFQKYPKPPKSSVPKPTWSQRAVANQSLGPRTAMISHLQHGPNSKGEKSGNLKPGMLTPSHPVNLEFFALGKHQFLCLNTWNLAISFWSITKLEFIILFDQSVFWSNLAWRFFLKGKGRKGGEQERMVERTRKEQKEREGNKKEQKKKKTGLQSKAKARNLPNTKPNTDDFLDPKKVGDW